MALSRRAERLERPGMRNDSSARDSCNLNEVVARATEKLRPLIEESGSVVKCDDALPSVRAHQPSMVVVFENLIANAIKFRGKEPARVHVSARRDSGKWIFSVADNGRGFAPEDAERLFKAFEFLDCRSAHLGADIGLAISKKIVEDHGGLMWAESKPGAGSTFYVALPG